jgi:hypothetical protein
MHHVSRKLLKAQSGRIIAEIGCDGVHDSLSYGVIVQGVTPLR